MELTTCCRINAGHTGQFARTLIICEDRGHVSYLEGCTAPMRDENPLHAAVVELVALEDAELKYSTVQNWYPGAENGRSAERRRGKEWVSTLSYRWSPHHFKHKNKTQI